MSLAEWRATGQDKDSRVADPMFLARRRATSGCVRDLPLRRSASSRGTSRRSGRAGGREARVIRCPHPYPRPRRRRGARSRRRGRLRQRGRSPWTAEFLADSRHHLAVAVDEGRVVGMASAVHYVHPDKPPELWINEVGVAPTHRGLGIGRAPARRPVQARPLPGLPAGVGGQPGTSRPADSMRRPAAGSRPSRS